MSRKLWLSVVMVAVGASLLVVAGFAKPSSAGAPASSAKHAATGGTLNYDLDTDIDFSDPALAYYVPSWEIEYATCLKLLNYPDANGPKGSQLVPEAATGFPKVSNGGKTYDFTVKSPGGTKFSDGSAVTPNSFAAELLRVLDPKMQSGGSGFFADIVGAQAMLDGKATTASGIKVSGNHLIINLTKPAPDFLARIAMPFVCAIPPGLAHDPNGVNTLPGAGPYYIAARTPNKSITLKRNPNYKGKRPHNVDTIQYTIGNSLDAQMLRLESGQTDLGGVPASAYAGLAAKYGVNKGRFYVKPNLGVWYLAFNHDRPLFKTGGVHGNVNLKRAINFALDRHALVIQSGAFSGRRTDQVLPPGMAGFKACNCYPTVKPPNFATAKKLAAGHTGSGNAVLYTFTSSYGPLWAQIIQFDLKQIGVNVEVKPFARAVEFQKAGTKGEPFDMEIDGWSADYPDPYDFINVLLSGDTIQDSNNNNHAYFNDPVFNKKMNQAALLSGSARYSAYGQLDVDMMKQAAPWAPIRNPFSRIFTSSRVGCFTFNNVYANDLAADCIK
ncbi:MAG TPA: ABC transporter substrate-binding protein [Gaiellaceae bacterium]